jgi:hypothetical protein
MGNYSLLHTMLNSPEKCLIDWSKADTTKLYKLASLKRMHIENRPTTLKDVAECWNDTKFIGYLDKDNIDAIIEFCRCLIPYGQLPRLYYEFDACDTILYCFEFHPGTTTVMCAAIYYYSIEMRDEYITKTEVWNFKNLNTISDI